jgi:hypothetical protein
MTEELKQEYLKKMSYEEWEAKIFEGIKNRFYLTKTDLSSMNYITFYFKEDFKVAISKYHFDLWYNRYLYTDNYYVSIEQTIKELDDLITQYWLQKIKINS